MRTVTLDRVFALSLFLLGLYLIVQAIEYGYMTRTSPGPGFFPLWVGALLCLLSLCNLVRSLRGQEAMPDALDRPGLAKTAGIVCVLVAFILIVEHLGMYLSTLLTIVAIALIIQARPGKAFIAKVTATAVLFPALGQLIFGRYLNVPLPTGVLGF